MQSKILIKDGQARVELSDKLTFEDHSAFRNLLSTVAGGGARECVFDLQHLTSIDSAGLGMLMIAHETAESEGWNMALHRPQGQVKRMLEVTEFGKVISIVP